MRPGRPPRTYPREVTPSREPAATPAAFAAGRAALQAVLDGPLRRGLTLTAAPAPKKMAPFCLAVAAEVDRDGEDVASGRFVVLHDPAGQDGWHGDTRIVSLVEAQVEAEMAADPALADVGWSWLLEALQAHDARHIGAAGTVTRTVSKRFGRLEDDDLDDSEVEIRASWSPVPGAADLDLGSHLLAWCDLLCSTAGLPPEGVVQLADRARRVAR